MIKHTNTPTFFFWEKKLTEWNKIEDVNTSLYTASSSLCAQGHTQDVYKDVYYITHNGKKIRNVNIYQFENT